MKKIILHEYSYENRDVPAEEIEQLLKALNEPVQMKMEFETINGYKYNEEGSFKSCSIEWNPITQSYILIITMIAII